MAIEAMLAKAVDGRFVACLCAYEFYGDFLLQSGRIEEGYRMYRRALDQKPLQPLALIRTLRAARMTGRLNEARELSERASANWGGSIPEFDKALANDRALHSSDWVAAAAASA